MPKVRKTKGRRAKTGSAALTADAAGREAAAAAVARNARGSVLISKGKFVTPRDKSLDKLDRI